MPEPRKWSVRWLVIVLAAIVGISMGCDAEKVADMPTNTSGEIAIIALKEPSLAECEEAFGAAATMNVPHAHPSTASVEQIEETIGLFLVRNRCQMV